MLAPRKVLERGRDLVSLLHARAERAAATEDEDVAGLDARPHRSFDGADGRPFGREHFRRALHAIDAVRADDARVDRRRFDDRAVRGEVAARERHRRDQAALASLRRTHDYRVRIDAVAACEQIAHPRAMLGVLPPVEYPAEWLARGRQRGQIQQTELA